MATDRLIPLGVYFEGDNFYSLENNKGRGHAFYSEWKEDSHRFPQSKGAAQLHMAANMQAATYSNPQPRAERPTPDEFQDAIALLFDMAAKQANCKVKQGYIQVGAWLRDLQNG